MNNYRNSTSMNLVFIGKAATVGLAGGLILIVIYSILGITWIWPSFMFYNLWQIQMVQAISAMLLMSILTGIVSIVVNFSSIKDGNGSYNIIALTASGIVSGIATIAPGLATFILPVMLQSPMNEMELLLAPSTLMLAPLIIVTASAVIYPMLISRREYSKVKPNTQKGDRKILLAVSIMVILTIAVPPVTANIMANTGLLSSTDYTYWYTVVVTVDRTSNDTITIKNSGGDDVDRLDTSIPFTILVNGKDVSNSEAAEKSGMSVIINPASGLGREAGSSVNITGIDVMPQNLEYNNGSILVIAHYNERKNGKVLDTILNNNSFTG